MAAAEFATLAVFFDKMVMSDRAYPIAFQLACRKPADRLNQMKNDLPFKSNGATSSEPFVRSVKIRNYKSIGKCNIELKRLTILVGRNGSGKSNFLDALRFVSDALQTSIDHAIKSRGGIGEVRRKSTGHPRNFAIEIEANLDRYVATYAFEIAGREGAGFVVKQEQCQILDGNGSIVSHYRVAEGEVTSSSLENPPTAAIDRLYLVVASGFPRFRELYDALLTMGFYNLNPEIMKELQSPDAGEILHRDGDNIASVIARIDSQKPELKERIKHYLAVIVPGVSDFNRVSLGPKETVQFRQKVVGSDSPWKFYANSMSDGTLRALGTLVAVMQLASRDVPVRLVGIEEPETALHPAAVAALMDCLREASSHTQIIITSHSPDLLDQIDLERDQVLAVSSIEGDTRIGPIDAASGQALAQHLYTAGELLRMDQFEPDQHDLERQQQLPIFEESP